MCAHFKSQRRIGYFFLALFLFCSSIAGQGPASEDIAGQVVDGFRHPVVGAEVRLYLNSFILISHARTDAQGAFAFRELPDRQYILAIKKPGFDEFKIAVKPENSTSRAQFTLRVASIAENITVTASRGEAQNTFEAAESTNTISTLELGKRPALVDRKSVV